MPNLPLITLFGNHKYSDVELILAFIVDSNLWVKRTIDVFCDKLVVTLALSNLWFFAKLSAMCRHNTSLSPWVRWGFFNAWMIHRRVLIGLTNEQKKTFPWMPFEGRSESLENYCSVQLRQITRKSGFLERYWLKTFAQYCLCMYLSVEHGVLHYVSECMFEQL